MELYLTIISLSLLVWNSIVYFVACMPAILPIQQKAVLLFLFN